MASDGDEPALVIDFDDTWLLAPLFGEHDSHLAIIEQRLELSLVPRGNRIAILGSADAAQIARTVLDDLYQRLKDGLEVTVAEVNAALRMASSGATEENNNSKKMSVSKSARVADNHKSGPRRTTGSEDTIIRTQKRLITPRSPNQSLYIDAMRNHDLVFGLGPAGTGKTYLAVAVAVSMLLENQIERIIMTRPAVESGERLGFLPGALEEKVDPYMRPMFDALYEMMPGERVIRRRDTGDIEVAPLAYMRGRNLANSFVILDEAQNTTTVQMKMFLTRLGEDSRMVVTGDPSQVDLPAGTRSGLRDATNVLGNIGGIEMVKFNADDVVRHPLVSKIIRAYDDHSPQSGDGVQ